MSFLSRLFGKKPEAPEPPPEFLQSQPPDWLIDLKGQEFPAGNRFSIRAQVWVSARAATADLLVLPLDEGAEPQSLTANLGRLELDRLLVILGFSFPQDIVEIPGAMDSGLPVAVTIFRGEPLAAQSAECNLTDWLDSQKSAP